MKKILIIGGVLTLAGGIYFWGKYQAELAKNLVYDMKNAKLRKLNASEVVADFDFEIKNTTDLKVNISSIYIDVLANNMLVTNITNKKEVTVDKNSTSFIPLVLRLDPKKILKSGADLLTIASSLKSTVLTFKGVVKIKKIGINIPVPFSYTTTYGELMG